MSLTDSSCFQELSMCCWARRPSWKCCNKKHKWITTFSQSGQSGQCTACWVMFGHVLWTCAFKMETLYFKLNYINSFLNVSFTQQKQWMHIILNRLFTCKGCEAGPLRGDCCWRADWAAIWLTQTLQGFHSWMLWRRFVLKQEEIVQSDRVCFKTFVSLCENLWGWLWCSQNTYPGELW